MNEVLAGFQALAAIVVAVFTGILWWATKKYADAAVKQAKLTEDLASAAVKQAELTEALASAAVQQATATEATLEHLKNERDEGQRPYLTWNGVRSGREILNVGRGPAINAYAMRGSVNSNGVFEWQVSPRFDLGPLGDWTISSWPLTLPEANPDLTMAAQVLFFCQDQSGAAFFFKQVTNDVDRWMPGDGSAEPPWAGLARQVMKV